MAWQNPKTDWVANPKNPVPEDFNRIEGNIHFLKQDIETKKGLIVDAINDMNQPVQVTDTHAQLASKIRDISKDATATVNDVEKGKTFYAGGQKRTGTLELTGNATPAQVLAGRTFYNDNLKSRRTGTMPNRGAVNHALPINGSYTVPAGYHNGAGKVTQSIPTQGAQTITPTTTNQTIASGRYLTGTQTIKGDANLIPANIVLGKTIFGVVGTYAVPGNTVLFDDSHNASEVIGTTFELYFQYTSTYTGIIRFFYSFYTDVHASCQVHLNGVPVGAMHVQEPGTDKDYILDMYIKVGDKLQIYAKQNYDAEEYATYLGAVKIYC